MLTNADSVNTVKWASENDQMFLYNHIFCDMIVQNPILYYNDLPNYS